MKKIIYLGMQNKPFEVFETVSIERFKPKYNYTNNEGRRIMLKSLKNISAYTQPFDHKRYVNRSFPILEKGKLYNIDILNHGYNSHYFELVTI